MRNLAPRDCPVRVLAERTRSMGWTDDLVVQALGPRKPVRHESCAGPVATVTIAVTAGDIAHVPNGRGAASTARHLGQLGQTFALCADSREIVQKFDMSPVQIGARLSRSPGSCSG